MLSSAVQPLKANSAIDVLPFGSFTVFNDVHPLNAPDPIVETLSGKSNVVNEVHWLKA